MRRTQATKEVGLPTRPEEASGVEPGEPDRGHQRKKKRRMRGREAT